MNVVVLLRGGLGNQLFQLAAGLGLLGASGGGLRLVSYGSEWGPEHPDAQSLTGIPIEYPDRLMRSTIPGIAVHETWRDSVSSVIAGFWGMASGAQVIRQSDPFAPRSTLPRRMRSAVLDGFFQHSDWWEDSWRQVAQRILDRQPEGVEAIRGEARTVVKLRRSDYLGRGIVLTDAYYRAALDALGVHDCEVVVVTEDHDYLPHFSRLLAERGCAVRSPEPITGNPNVDDFWHLAAAGRQVLANSSYCWWSAAVSEVAERVDGATSPRIALPEPWLPNSWSAGPLPPMGLPGWRAVPAEFT